GWRRSVAGCRAWPDHEGRSAASGPCSNSGTNLPNFLDCGGRLGIMADDRERAHGMMSEPSAKPSPPRDFDTLRSAILERKGDLPKRLVQVAAYALDHPDEIAFGTA